MELGKYLRGHSAYGARMRIWVDPQNPHKKTWVWGHALAIPTLGIRGRGPLISLWGFLANQPTLLGKPQASGWLLKISIRCWALIALCTNTNVHIEWLLSLSDWLPGLLPFLQNSLSWAGRAVITFRLLYLYFRTPFIFYSMYWLSCVIGSQNSVLAASYGLFIPSVLCHKLKALHRLLK